MEILEILLCLREDLLISSHDVGIDYTDDWYLLALYDKTQQEIEAFEKELNSEFGGITIEKLS